MRPRALLLAAVLTLVLAPSAGAEPVSMPYSENFLAVAYGLGHVLVAEPGPGAAKSVAIRDLRLADRSDRVLLEIPYSEAEAPDVELVANASGYVAALGGAHIRVIEGDYDSAQRTLLDCAPTRRSQLAMAAGTASFALAGLPCGPAGPVTVTADGTLTPAGSEPAADALAYAEPFLALRSGDTTTVRDLTTGAERRVASGDAESIAVTTDGTLLKPTTDGLFAWPPGATEPSLLFKRPAGGVAVVAGRAVFDTFTAPRIVGLGGGTAHTLSTPGAGLTSLLGFDGTHAAFQSFSCAGARQVTVVDVDAPRAPGEVSGCPVRIAAYGLRFPKSGKATIRVSCPNGCRARLRLVEQSTERRPCDALDDTGRNQCRTIATARLDLPAAQGRRPVHFTLTRTGRRLRGRTLDVITSSRGNSGLTFHGEIRRAVLAGA